MQRVRINLTGTSPLVCHNERLADPDDEFVKAIGVLNKKGKNKTEDDRREVERLEWFGGLYVAAGIDGPVMPAKNIRACIIRGAVQTKEGTTVKRALNLVDFNVPIIYEGPRDPKALWAKHPEFRYRAMVRVTGRVPRMRPQFPAWAISCDAILLDNVMDLVALQRVVENAGLMEGLGDNRVNGYGRFVGEVIAV